MLIIKQLTIILIALCCWFNFIFAAFASSLMDEALDNYLNKRYHAAAALFEQVIKKEPTNAQAYYYLGSSYEQLKDRDSAKTMYEACFKLNPFSDQGRQAKAALMSLINNQAALGHPYDEPATVNTTVHTINQEARTLGRYKLNDARDAAAYQLAVGYRRVARHGYGANLQPYWNNGYGNFYYNANAIYGNGYFNYGNRDVSNQAYIDTYDILSYAQRNATRALSDGYTSARYAQESGNNLVNSLAEQVKPNEPKLRALGTNLYVRNYSYINNDDVAPADPLLQLKATAGKLNTNNLLNSSKKS